MESLNPVEWLAYLYGKWPHPILGGLATCTFFAMFGLLLWVRAVDKYKEEHPKPQVNTVPAEKAKNPNANSASPPAEGPHEKSTTPAGKQPSQADKKQLPPYIQIDGDSGEADIDDNTFSTGDRQAVRVGRGVKKLKIDRNMFVPKDEPPKN